MPNDARNETTGQFKQKYPNEAFIEAVRVLGPMAASRDIAERVGCNHITDNERLRTLADDGQLNGQHHAGAILWSLSASEL